MAAAADACSRFSADAATSAFPMKVPGERHMYTMSFYACAVCRDYSCTVYETGEQFIDVVVECYFSTISDKQLYSRRSPSC